MDYQDYYKTLGVERSADKSEIKRAYRKLARKYHPDVSKAGNAEAKFKEVGEAYEVLRDEEKRKAYDQLGANWKDGQSGFQPPPDWSNNFDFGGAGAGRQGGRSAHGGAQHDFSGFFDDLFGGGGGVGGHARNPAKKGQNIRAKVKIDLEDSLNGATRSFTLQIPEQDSQGRVLHKNRTLKVKIPKGIKAGQSIRLGKQGKPGSGGGVAGDLLLEIQFKKHKLYTVEGKDIYLNLPVAPWELMLGTKIEVPTPAASASGSSKIGIKIAADSKAGKKLRLKGRGLPGKDAGNFYVVLQASLPPSSDAKAKVLYEQMRDELEYDPRRDLF